MNLFDCINCKWCYARHIGKFTDYMCTWRRFNALAKNKYGEELLLTPGRTIRIERLKVCPQKNQKAIQ